MGNKNYCIRLNSVKLLFQSSQDVCWLVKMIFQLKNVFAKLNDPYFWGFGS